jgi:hypothetical protein
MDTFSISVAARTGAFLLGKPYVEVNWLVLPVASVKACKPGLGARYAGSMAHRERSDPAAVRRLRSNL